MRALIILFLITGVPCMGQSCRVFTMQQAIDTAFAHNPLVRNDSLRRETAFQIKSAWFNWIYSIKKKNLYAEYGSAITDLQRIAGLRFKAGDLDYYETSLALDRMAGILTNAAISENETSICHNVLRRILFVTDTLVPADTSLDLFEIDKSFAFNIAEPDKDSTGYREFVHDTELENRLIELDNLFIRMHYYKSYALGRAEALVNIARAKLQSEEIDYIEYSALISEAYKIRFDYLDILNRYNQSAIQLEHYAY